LALDSGFATDRPPIYEVKISSKISKLARPLTYRRAWRRAQRHFFPLPLGPVRRAIDPVRLRQIQQRYQGSSAGHAKYADIEVWLRLNRERVQDLRLHRSPPKRVLDLGCGGGFFLLILKTLGHSVLGLDAERAPLYTELVDLFDIPRIIWMIKPFEPLPDFEGKFDWITAFSVCFNGDRSTGRLWGSPEWDFLLRDLQRQLVSGGKLFFGLNPKHAGNYYTPELRDFFLSRGATVERERIFFPRGVKI